MSYIDDAFPSKDPDKPLSFDFLKKALKALKAQKWEFPPTHFTDTEAMYMNVAPIWVSYGNDPDYYGMVEVLNPEPVKCVEVVWVKSAPFKVGSYRNKYVSLTNPLHLNG